MQNPLWTKSSDGTTKKPPPGYNNSSFDWAKENNDEKDSTNSSKLSLHIPNFEKSFEADNKSDTCDKSDSKQMQKVRLIIQS